MENVLPASSPSLPPAHAGALPLHRVAPQKTLGTVLWFGWTAVWLAFWTILLSPGVVLHSMVQPTTRTFKRWMAVWSRLVLFSCGIRLQTDIAMPLDPEQPVVLVANHQNALDIVTTAAGVPYPFGFTAKEALRKVPFVGWVLRHTACVFVDRSTPRKALQSLTEAGEEIRKGHSVLVFCEGVRTWRTTLAPFLRGAFLLAVEAGVPVVPVVVDGNAGLYDERRGVARPGVTRLAVGTPISTEGLGRDDVPALMQQVRAWMAAELDLAE